MVPSFSNAPFKMNSKSLPTGRQANIEIEFNGYRGIRLSGSACLRQAGVSEYQGIRPITFWSFTSPDIPMPDILHPDFLVS
jgi:hypothetical protein